MGGSRRQGACGHEEFDLIFPELSPGPLGFNDCADSEGLGEIGDSPGPVGVGDASAALSEGGSAGGAATGAGTSAGTAASLTPAGFAGLYHNVRVSFLDRNTGMANSVSVDVHRYNNYATSSRANFTEKSALSGLVRSELRRAGGLGLIDVEESHLVMIAHAFYGKAMPEEFAVALRHALRYNRAATSSLQSWCDNTARLGLDCSGFVNAYFQRTGRIETPMSISSYEQRGQARTAPGQIAALDVLVWQRASVEHIAVVDRLVENSNPLQVVVVESSSTGGGLTESTYTVRENRGDLFRVGRGFNRRGSESEAESQVKFVSPP